MKTTDRLLINITEVREDGLEVKGILPASTLDLSSEQSERQYCPNPATYELTAFIVSHSLLVRGRVQTTARCRCDRCLTYFDLELTEPDVCHYFEGVDEGQVDITDDIREDLLILFPTRELCSEDCKGLCPACGQNLNTRACDCKTDEGSADNVWHQLDGLDL